MKQIYIFSLSDAPRKYILKNWLKTKFSTYALQMHETFFLLIVYFLHVILDFLHRFLHSAKSVDDLKVLILLSFWRAR